MNNLGKEPAFPTEVSFADNQMQESFQTGNEKAHYSGMSKRFYAACAAMQGMLTNIEFIKVNGKTAIQNNVDPDKYLIRTAYSLADELLKQEQE